MLPFVTEILSLIVIFTKQPTSDPVQYTNNMAYNFELWC